MEDLRSAFKEFDTNEDGFISKDELARVMINFDSLVSEQDLEQMITLADKDGNGSIDFNEFLQLMSTSMKEQSIEDEMRALFDAIDTARDGCITEDELSNMMERLGEKVKKKDIREMLRAGGASKDGKISFPEFRMMMERFMK